ncbi:MAG TPA: S8 family serine peptidase [Gemmatimonadaceae bacterium]|jgi:subtilisin family serine protease|nr:S8 family serine peptidase [Gemmatimonadaceae bacterium]
MSRTRLSLSLVSALALAACTSDRVDPVRPFEAGPASRSVSPATGRYLVSVKKNFPSDFAARVAALGGTVELQHAGAGLAVVSGVSAANAAQLGTISGVDEVQADEVLSLDVPAAAVQADVANVTVNSQLNPTTAARYAWQWNMRSIHANTAWAAGKLGSPAVTVAILDTGIDYDAPDLNGLVDLSRSTSFVPSDDSISTAYFPTRSKISDYNGHGTNVATQVSSKAFALAGVTSKTTLIGVKVLAQSGSGSFAGVLSGVLWAADHNADVANMSLGGSFSKAGNGRFVATINKVFNYANKQGMTIVVSAGNASADLDHNGNVFSTYCDAPHVICVSAVGPATVNDDPDAVSYYTNFGRSAITVAAPGGNADAANGFTVSNWPWGPDIASWVWSYCSKTRIAGFTGTGAPILTACAAGNRLSGFIGTSQASPHVAGLAALIVAETGKGKPNQVKHVIVKSADDLGARGRDPFYGEGRINVAKAVGL